MAIKMKLDKLYWIVVVLAVVSYGCEVVRIPMCKRMPYNMTRMPNLLHHSTQENAILAIEQFEELLDQNCSNVLLFFLCAMYAPICTYEFHSDAIPPCKGVCEQARAGCEPIMNKYNVSWPKGLDCKELPLYDRGVCVSPEAIVSTLPDDKRRGGQTGDKEHPNVSSSSKDCQCKKKERPSRKVYRKNGYQFAIQGKLLHSVQTGGYWVSRIQTLNVLVSGKIPIQAGIAVDLWSNTTCVCPELSTDREYLIVGYEDQQNNKLLFLENSLAVPWRKKWERRVKNWAKRGKNRRRARNGRRSGRKRNAKDRKSGESDKQSKRKGRDGNRKKSRRRSGRKSSRRKHRKDAPPSDDSSTT